MAPRAIWKGHLKVSELVCPVALYAAASTSDRVAFHMLNRATGHRVRREYVDTETGEAVERDDQVKGYETASHQFVVLEPEDMAAAVPESDKTLAIESFLDWPDIDTTYFDRPYFLAPADSAASSAFAVIREGMRAQGVAALARAVLFRRVRTVLIRAQGPGLVANTLNFNHEVRPAHEVFDAIPDLKIKGEMLDLAKHIIDTKRGTFDPRTFEDRYDAALVELVRAKAEGRKIEAPKRPKEDRVVNLMEALRQSAGAAKSAAKPARRPARSQGTKREAG